MSTPGPCGARCRRSTPGSPRSPTGPTTTSRRPTPTRTCAGCGTRGSAATSSTAAPAPPPTPPADARRMRDQYFASGRYGRLRMGLGLRGPAFTSAARNAVDYAFARDLGLPISIHVGMAGTGHAVADLDRYVLLGPDVNYVHGNFLTDREWDL